MQNEKCKVKSEQAPCGILHSAFCILHLRRAFTLVELLVVIAIISTVTLATVPMILPALDSRRIRESARIVSTQFASAQSEAIARGRSVGVWIERLSSDPSASMDLFLCEVPQTYAGDSENSLAQVKVNGGVASFILSTGTDVGWQNQLRPGDLVRFNYRGAYYVILGEPANKVVPNPQDNTQVVLDPAADSSNPQTKTIAISPINPANPQLPTPSLGGVPYQIYRQPVKLTGGVAQLPAGAVIDLVFSGVGSAQLWQSAFPVQSGSNTYTLTLQNGNKTSSFVDTTDATEKAANQRLPIIVTFDKTGALENLYIRGPAAPSASGGPKRVELQAIRLTTPIHFLIGKREKSYSLNSSNTAGQNWTDLENIWVSLNPQTGLVTTAEVAAIPTGSTTQLHDARTYAQAAQTMGGR
jgi:prepilin-type N-terminal cleavage/methylation domain-containing protein